jgi:hypothetical protein
MKKNYQRRWEVRLENRRIGEVLAFTEQAACVRAIKRFNITKDEDRRRLSVRRIEKGATA